MKITDIAVCEKAIDFLTDERNWGNRIAGERKPFCRLCDFCYPLLPEVLQ